MKNWVQLPPEFYRESNPNHSEDSYYLVNLDNVIDIFIEDWIEDVTGDTRRRIAIRAVAPHITYAAYFDNEHEFEKMQIYLATLGLPTGKGE